MHIRKSNAVVALLVLVAMTAAGSAMAQGGSDGWGGNGKLCLQAATGTDLTPTAGFDLDLMARLRAGVLSTFSWGRGTMGRPGLLRSSTAVLRERRGLMLR
jgi:hypothetical protein